MIFGSRISIEHASATYELHLSSRIGWYIDEDSCPNKSYVADITPLEWRLLKREGIAAVTLTEYADFDKIKQYAIE